EVLDHPLVVFTHFVPVLVAGRLVGRRRCGGWFVRPQDGREQEGEAGEGGDQSQVIFHRGEIWVTGVTTRPRARGFTPVRNRNPKNFQPRCNRRGPPNVQGPLYSRRR